MARLASACVIGDAGLCHDGGGARARQQLSPHPKKEATRPSCSAGTMVCPGNPPRGHTPPAATHRARLRDRLVRLATRASGDGTNLTSQAEGATVMLERVDIQASHGPANLIQAPFGSGDLGERSASDFERSPMGSDGTTFAGQTHGSRPNGGRIAGCSWKPCSGWPEPGRRGEICRNSSATGTAPLFASRAGPRAASGIGFLPPWPMSPTSNTS